MQLKNDHVVPEGGYKYYCPQTNWPRNIAQEFYLHSLDMVVDKVIAHRRANPRFSSQPEWSVDPAVVRQQIIDFTCYCKPTLCVGSGGGASKKSATPLPLVARAVAGFVEDVKAAVGGVGAWLEWLGPTGEVVEQDLANRRAEVCLTCPQNKTGGLLAFFSIPMANRVKDMLGVKAEMKLATPHDEKLNVCSACRCPIPLIIWATLDFKLANLSDEARGKLDPRCWVLAEEAARK